MNIFKKIGAFLKKFGKLIWAGMEEAGVRGLTDDIVEVALEWVKVAAQQQLSNDKKRAFVVKVLAEKFPGIPESVIRLAVELAVQILKKQAEKI